MVRHNKVLRHPKKNMHSLVIASTLIWAFVDVVMTLYATQNFGSLRTPALADLRTIPFFEGLAGVSVVLLPFLALATTRHKYSSPWCFVYVIFWIFALAMVIMNLVLVTNFDALPITVSDGRLGGAYGDGLVAVSSLTLIFMFFSWIMPESYWIVTEETTTVTQTTVLVEPQTKIKEYVYY